MAIGRPARFRVAILLHQGQLWGWIFKGRDEVGVGWAEYVRGRQRVQRQPNIDLGRVFKMIGDAVFEEKVRWRGATRLNPLYGA